METPPPPPAPVNASTEASEPNSVADLSSVRARIAALPRDHQRVVRIPVEGDAAREQRCVSYPEFGLYLWRSERVLLAVRCGGVDGRTMTAHAHLDQLGVELNVDGDDWIADPGTYLYTALPQRRDAYRRSRRSCRAGPGGRQRRQADIGVLD